MNRLHVTKTILWAIVGLGSVVAVTRYLYGLGATTNLTDATPWGVWIGFDVMAGVALAAGGFVLTAAFYILRREEFHPLVRPAVLTAFLGYIAVVFSLLVDLGLPWNIWHMIVYWNPHSPLFEVGWCVMLYTTVLLLEFSPVPLEQTSRWAGVRRVLMKARFPLVLLGIMLSTLHQSSLGSLFLITPFKSHPLWYSNILPIQFFISAIALGLMTVSLESLVSAWLYRRPAETHLLAKLGRAVLWVLLIYFFVRMGDIALTGKLPVVFAGTWESFLFVAELLIMVVVPVVLLLLPRVSPSCAGQWIISSLVVGGTVFNRINVGGLTMMRTTGDVYFPSWMELAISAAVIAAMALVFLFAVEKFRVWEERPREQENDPHARPQFSRSEVWLGIPAIAGRTKYSLAFVAAFGFGFAMMPGEKIDGRGVVDISVTAARGGDTLFVDGNRDGFGVAFAHTDHINRFGGKQSCVLCHHANLPSDRQSACAGCHYRMYQAADAFRHDWHAAPRGANIACYECHAAGQERTAQTAAPCDRCHRDLIPKGAIISVNTYLAVSYVDAMHETCIDCHRRKAVELTGKPNLARCATCHGTTMPEQLPSEIVRRLGERATSRVILPPVETKTTAHGE